MTPLGIELTVLFWGAVAGGWALRWRTRRLDAATANVRLLRAQLARPSAYREPADDDHRIVELAQMLEPACAELAALGLARVCTLLVTPDGATAPIAITTWFVDAAGTTRAYAMMGNALGAALLRVMILSSTAEQQWLTVRQRGRYTVPSPPHVSVAEHPRGAALADVLAAHRARIPAGTALARIATTAELVAELHRARAQNIAWRETQAPEALLDHDLRKMLGPRYARDGERLRARLGGTLPPAKIVSR